MGGPVFIMNPESGLAPAPVYATPSPALDRALASIAAKVEAHLRFAAWTEARSSEDQQLACDARAEAAALRRRAFDLVSKDWNLCTFCDDNGRVALGSETCLCGICSGTKRLPISTQMPLFCTLCNGTCRY